MDVAAWAALNNEATQYHDGLLPPCYSAALDCSQPAPSTIITELVEPTIDGEQPPGTHITPSPSPLLVEEALALEHLTLEGARPAVEGHSTHPAPLPRKQRQRYVREATGPVHVEFLTGVNARGYGKPRKRGKPLDKGPVQREVVANSHSKIVVTGPDHVGCTTLLQLLG